LKKVKTKVKLPDFRVWCEECCIRIAPYEEKLVALGKTYHQTCYVKPAAQESGSATPKGQDTKLADAQGS